MIPDFITADWRDIDEFVQKFCERKEEAMSKTDELIVKSLALFPDHKFTTRDLQAFTRTKPWKPFRIWCENDSGDDPKYDTVWQQHAIAIHPDNPYCLVVYGNGELVWIKIDKITKIEQIDLDS